MELTPNLLRETFGKFATGVTVMSLSDGEGRALGVTANSFTSVSLEPPLILWCLRCEASIHPLFMENERFAVNILAADSKILSDRQASKHNHVLPEGTYHLAASGVPVLGGAMASLSCRTIRRDAGGDHTIFLAKVEHIQTGQGGDPLLFFGGQYHALAGSGPEV